MRPRQHGAAGDPRMAAGIASSRAAEAKRRRANVLFLLVLTTVCAGFLAATTDSKAMVYLFAVSMVALGGYVYLLVTINQQQFGEREPSPRRPRRRAASQRVARRAGRPTTTTVLGARRRPVGRPRSAGAMAYRRSRRSVDGDPPGSGQSGLISYGRGAAEPPAVDPARSVRPRGLRWDAATRETTRRAPARNGRHATGQVPVQRTRRPESSPDYYSHAG